MNQSQMDPNPERRRRAQAAVSDFEVLNDEYCHIPDSDAVEDLDALIENAASDISYEGGPPSAGQTGASQSTVWKETAPKRQASDEGKPEEGGLHRSRPPQFYP